MFLSDINFCIPHIHFRVIRETVLSAREVLLNEIKDISSDFYTCKKLKAKKGGFRGDRITADDIVWYLGEVWTTSYHRALVSNEFLYNT